MQRKAMKRQARPAPPGTSSTNSLRFERKATNHVAQFIPARDSRNRRVHGVVHSQSSSPPYIVTADIQQIHGISGSDAILEICWCVEPSGKVVVRRYDTLGEPIMAGGYAAVFKAKSQLLARFAENIARLFPEH
jgi:uncharacterized lipoprotein YmbA